VVAVGLIPTATATTLTIAWKAKRELPLLVAAGSNPLLPLLGHQIISAATTIIMATLA
jgi:hypothetical protein